MTSSRCHRADRSRNTGTLADPSPDARRASVGRTRHAVEAGTGESMQAGRGSSPGRNHRTASNPDRVLATMLFTDIVDSTSRVAQMGDEAWASTIRHHDHLCRATVSSLGGTFIKSTGDGLLATFDRPGLAIDCAKALAEDLRRTGIEIRAGIHTSEIQRLDADISGIGVHLAARILDSAGAGEVWVSAVVTSLVVGSARTFTDQGTHRLRGIPGFWQLASVE